MTALVSDGNLLFAELLKRRRDIELLLGNVTAMTQQLSGLVDDNQESLRPRLAELNRVIALLRANKANIGASYTTPSSRPSRSRPNAPPGGSGWPSANPASRSAAVFSTQTCNDVW